MATTEDKSKEFDQLYEKYNLLIHKLSLKYSSYDDYLAEDATQHAFLQLYVKMTEGEEIRNVETYLHTLVKNYIINALKKTGREVSQGESEEYFTGENCRAESAEEEFVYTAEGVRTIKFAELMLEEIRKKNETWYTIIVEVYWNEKSQKEVAEELGMSDTAMYATLRRIRKWANKHKVQFEGEVEKMTKGVSKEHSFFH